MRALLWSLLAALLLILIGAYPVLAVAIGSLLLAAFHGAALLIAQPAVQIIGGLVAAVWLIRTRRLA